MRQLRKGKENTIGKMAIGDIETQHIQELIEEYANPIVWADRKTGLNIKCCSSFYQPQ